MHKLPPALADGLAGRGMDHGSCKPAENQQKRTQQYLTYKHVSELINFDTFWILLVINMDCWKFRFPQLETSIWIGGFPEIAMFD